MSIETGYLSVISGRSQGTLPRLIRLGLRVIEPAYRGVIQTRNSFFDFGLFPIHHPGVPTVSVGNLTTGGTGKTPVVQWLAGRWRKNGGNPGVLLRGYRSSDGLSDEQQLYQQQGIESQADPDRLAGARVLLERVPQTDLLILDDGFQHRRVRRDFDLVLIDASNPFGYGHLLPRGLLREPPTSLNRADAVLITRSGPQSDRLTELKQHIRRFARDIEIFVSDHVFAGLKDRDDQPVPIERLGRCLVVAGIGNVQALIHMLDQQGLQIVSTWVPGDHYAYSPSDIDRIKQSRGVDSILTTEKDWVKLRRFKGVEQLPIYRIGLRIDFSDGDEDRLFEMIRLRVSQK